MAVVLVIVIAAITSSFWAGPVSGMLAQGLATKNYRGEDIPTAMGIVMLLSILVGLGTLVLLDMVPIATFSMYAFWLTLVCLAGLLDDAAGNHQSRGFRGHFSALFRGQLTTGMAKVFIIAGGAVLITNWPFELMAWAQVVVLLLAVNLFNQLDLRPGRALKAFLAISIVFIPWGNLVAAAGWGAGLGLVGGDLKARFMLGDTGANLLGATLGLLLITSLAGSWLYTALIILAMANAVGELLSFNRLIGQNSVLSWLDGLGRQENNK